MKILEPRAPRAGKAPKQRKLAGQIEPTGVERRFGDDEIIVSKTDLTGRITYVNRVFMRIAEFDEAELLGAPHSIIRHPDMPRCVFKLLWDTLQEKKEIFAYVKNMTRLGDHYWVFAHVTPSLAPGGEVLGYHSNRRTAEPRILQEVIEPLYRDLLAEERKHGDRKKGLERSFTHLVGLLEERGIGYDQFVFSL
ncbi:MAG: PAS domain-containing protein [Kiloniellales bacterium]|nr:PAS domain-containing protein [Kiloniellales bacterium]